VADTLLFAGSMFAIATAVGGIPARLTVAAPEHRDLRIPTLANSVK